MPRRSREDESRRETRQIMVGTGVIASVFWVLFAIVELVGGVLTGWNLVPFVPAVFFTMLTAIRARLLWRTRR